MPLHDFYSYVVTKEKIAFDISKKHMDVMLPIVNNISNHIHPKVD